MTGIPHMATILEASKESGLSYSCLYRMCKRNEIVYRKSGAKYLVNMDKLAEYLNGTDLEGGEEKCNTTQ